VFAFVVSSMLSAGLTLSIQSLQAQFKSARLVVAALAANFVLVPLSAYVITRAFPVQQNAAIALLLLGTAAGAPLLPKLVEFARGNLALAVGLMALLMSGTIITMPFVLPMILPGSRASAWSIAKPLLFVVLPALAAGLGTRAYREAFAVRIQPIFRLASNVTLVGVIVVAIAANISKVPGTGTFSAVVAGTIFIFASFGIGYALGGPDADTRKVLALGTTQRSSSIAFLVAVENFRGSDVVDALAILVSLALIIQVALAFVLGRYSKRRAGAVQQDR